MITFFSVLIGSWVGKEIILSTKVMLAGTVGFLICAYGNMVNDLYDIEIDRINNPKRPLVKGTVKKEIIILVTILFVLLGLIIALYLGLLPLIIASSAIVLLFNYGLFFKKTPLGNLAVAIVAGLSFLFGGAITGNYYSLIPFFFALLIHLPREIIKDVIDMKGDSVFNIRSLPLLWGERKALIISVFLLLILMIIIPLPFVYRFLSPQYSIFFLGLAYPLIIFTIIKILKESTAKNYILASTLLKIAMVIGLFAFMFG